MEGTRSSYHYDWYTDSPAVVHLRLSEGVLPPSPSPTPRGTREPEEETPLEAGSTSRLKFESAFYPFVTRVYNTASDVTHVYLISIEENEQGPDLSACTLQISYSTFIDLREVESYLMRGICVVKLNSCTRFYGQLDLTLIKLLLLLSDLLILTLLGLDFRHFL